MCTSPSLCVMDDDQEGDYHASANMVTQSTNAYWHCNSSKTAAARLGHAHLFASICTHPRERDRESPKLKCLICRNINRISLYCSIPFAGNDTRPRFLFSLSPPLSLSPSPSIPPYPCVGRETEWNSSTRTLVYEAYLLNIRRISCCTTLA